MDGTTNFLHGLPHWAVSIALGTKDNVLALYLMQQKTKCLLQKGKALMNDRRIRVSDRHRMIKYLCDRASFAGRTDLPETLRALAQLLPTCAGVRRWGAASLDLAYVAAGRYDGFWESRLNIWDIAAGIVLAREAGALIEGMAKGTQPQDTSDVLCATEVQFE